MSNNYMSEVFDFLRELRLNNDRNWFNSHKEQYDRLRDLWMADLQRLIELMKQYDDSLRGLQAKDCAYRIYRDVRFSQDKSPYKTYFSACLGKGGRKCSQSCYYIHFEPDNAGVYGGIWCPEPEIVAALRSLIDAEGDELQSLIDATDFASRFSFMPFQTLKKTPKGYPADHPHATLLKAKDYTFGCQVPNEYFISGDWVAKVADDMKNFKPVFDFLNYVFE